MYTYNVHYETSTGFVGEVEVEASNGVGAILVFEDMGFKDVVYVTAKRVTDVDTQTAV